MQTDYLIVGQGLAGTLLAYFLEKTGADIHVIDAAHQGAASKVAAGIINPVTGRRYVKSWRVDELTRVARKTYQQIEKEWGISFYSERNLVRTLNSQGEENDWLARTQDADYQHLMLENATIDFLNNKVKMPFAFAETTQTAQTNLSILTNTYQQRLLEKGQLSLEKFDYSALRFSENQVTYKAITARHIIFCEGYQAIHNPFFNDLPFHLAKGEVLIIHIPGAYFPKIVKDKVTISPLGKERYWVGATYDWKFEDDKPTETGKNALIEKLNQFLLLPYTIEQSLAAIRPTVRDRRPFLGSHPTLPNCHIFNGLGTKGASLAPLFAQEMCAYLRAHKSIISEVNIASFEKR